MDNSSFREYQTVFTPKFGRQIVYKQAPGGSYQIRLKELTDPFTAETVSKDK